MRISFQQSAAGRDPQAFPDPEELKLDRPLNSYLAFGDGPHQCFGRELALTYLAGVVKYVTSLKNIRPAAGGMGVLKTIKQRGTLYYLSEDWSSFSPYASSKLTPHFPYPLPTSASLLSGVRVADCIFSFF